MSAATVASPPRVALDADCVVLHRVSWKTYERLLADDEERRNPRISYDQGVMELVTPSMPHDEDADTIAEIVKIVAANLGVPLRSTGGRTFRRKDLERAFEADASFYIQSQARIRGQREVDLLIDPPPDMVLEMEVSRSAFDKLRLFAGMGIPEVWRCNGERVTIHLLSGETYREAPASAALPVLTREVLTRFLTLRRTMLSHDWFQLVSDWAREQRDSPSIEQD